MLTRLISCIVPVAAFATLGIHAARADAIDGEWCDPESRHFAIKGSEIVTPAGTKTVGNYSRHAFSYVIPPSEPEAGKQIFMRLMNETTVNLQVGTDPAAATQVWKRCEPTS
jgi:hypothetical protein